MTKILILIAFLLLNVQIAFADIVNPHTTNLITNLPGLISIFVIVVITVYCINSAKKKKDDK